jgi:hypothetical protein
MADEADSIWPGEEQQRVLRQLDRMVTAGRVTTQEAERLRAARDAAGFEAVMSEIRARHAGPELEAAVRAGQLSGAEAEDLQHQIRRGDHPRGLRRRLHQWSKPHRPPPGGE